MLKTLLFFFSSLSFSFSLICCLTHLKNKILDHPFFSLTLSILLSKISKMHQQNLRSHWRRKKKRRPNLNQMGKILFETEVQKSLLVTHPQKGFSKWLLITTLSVSELFRTFGLKPNQIEKLKINIHMLLFCCLLIGIYKIIGHLFSSLFLTLLFYWKLRKSIAYYIVYMKIYFIELWMFQLIGNVYRC